MATKQIDWVPGVGGPFIETLLDGQGDQVRVLRLDYHPDFVAARPDRLRFCVLVPGLILACGVFIGLQLHTWLI